MAEPCPAARSRFTLPSSRFPLPCPGDSMSDWLSNSERIEFEQRWNAHPGMKHMGCRVDLGTPGQVRCIVDPIKPEHRGGLGTEAVNGAVIAGVCALAAGP